MRIMVITGTLRVTGTNMIAVAYALNLRRAGQDVILISGCAPDPGLRMLTEALTIRTYLADDSVLDLMSGVERSALAQDIERWLQYHVRDFCPDVVICHDVGRILDQTAIARVSQIVPVAIVLHDEWFLTDSHYVTHGDGALELSFEPFRSTSLASHDFSAIWQVPETAGVLMAIAPSRWLRSRWVQVFPSLSCAVIPNPIDHDLFDLVDRLEARAAIGVNTDSVILGFVGDPRHKRKGFSLLSESIGLLPAESRPILLVAGGPRSFAGPAAVSALADCGFAMEPVAQPPAGLALGPAESHTVILPRIPRANLINVYGSMDLLVHPSKIENLPTVPIEAQYCGTRCYASDVGGTEDAVVNPDERFSPLISAEHLAERLIAQAELSKRESIDVRSERRRAAMARFGPDAHLDRLMPVLRELAS